MTAKRVRQKTMVRKKHNRVLIICFLLGIICIALVCYSLVQYVMQTAYTGIVDDAFAKTIGVGYAGNRSLTREETVCIISDLLCGIGQKGFENMQDSDAITHAVQIGILKGYDDGTLHLENPATKQESLVFIARGLDVFEDINKEQKPSFSSGAQFDEWARSGIEELVIQNYLSSADIDILRNLRENITASELEFLLNKISSAKNHHRSIYSYVNFCLNKYPIGTVFSAVSIVITILTPLIDFLRKQKKQYSRLGTICLAGTQSVGKTTLMRKMVDSGIPIHILKKAAVPTRARHVREIRLQSSITNEILCEGTIIDVPGSSPEEVLRFMAEPHRNKILLLILAHKKAYSGNEIDQAFVNEQLIDVQRTWAPAIKAHAMDLNKVVIFINKIDLLPQEYLPAQEYIYEEHIEQLCEAARVAGVLINVIEGSSTQGTNLNDLYTRLNPGDGRGGAYVEEE